jgi:hypothetical protein
MARTNKKCEHGKRRERCVDCGGSQICEHGVDRYGCKKCVGKGICEHNRERRRCSICDPKGTYKKVQDGATERGLSFLLTLEDFAAIVNRPCYFCGDSKTPRGIDRFDNSLGYEIENCVSCCKTCNMAKKTLHGLDFIQMCRKVAEEHEA